jgi:hypothetical protein
MSELRSVGELARDLSKAGGEYVAAWQIDRACADAGVRPAFVGGRRVFTPAEAAKVKEALARRQRAAQQ